jgi:hypothetical protein
MKTMFLAAAVGMLLLGGAAQAKAIESGASAVQPPDVAMAARNSRSPQGSKQFLTANPTGLPSYEMRSDGLLINGLLPATGWQG